jgi:protocatechuate 3,4-dioxygenase beta subunit
VVNSITGEPVRRAVVAALAEEDSHIVRSTQTDADGRFVLPSMPAGKFPLTASKRGFRTAFYDEHDEFNTAMVTGDGQDTGNLLFQLTPGAVLHGVVTGDGGDPVEGANVLLFQRKTGSQAEPQAGAPGGNIRQVDAAMTDDTGAYEFSDLAAGEYLLSVTATPWYAMHPQPGALRRTADDPGASLDVAYPVTYFDSTMDEAAATPIVVAGGDREQADINMHAVPALHLKVAAVRKGGGGIVRPELRQMVFGVQVSAESTGSVDTFRTGTVEFDGVAPGHYQLTQGDPARIVDFDATTSQEVDPGAGTPAMSVSGTLRTAAGAAVPDNLALLLEPSEGASGHPGIGQSPMQTNAHSGQFHFEAVPPGLWNLSVINTGKPFAIVSITADGTSSAGGRITVRDHPVTVAATVSQASVRVQGFARKDGKACPGAMIVLVPRQPAAYQELVRRDQSDSDGSFSLRDVPAGQYSVIAIEDGWKLDWMQRENLSRYLPAGIPVTVSDSTGAIVPLSGPVPVQSR